MNARPKSRRIVRGVSATLAAALLGGGLWWWLQEAPGRAMVAAARPPAPNLGAWAPELQRRFAAAAGGSVGALGELSRLYHANGFLREATRCYEGLEKLEPAEPRWLHRHATILAGYGEAEPALARWQRVVALAPDYLPARLRRGDLLLKSNRRDEAAAAYAQVLQRNAREPYALLGLARLAFEEGRWEESRTRLEQVVELTNYALGYDLIVTVYEHFGQHEQAVAIRRRAKASGAYRDPADPWMDELIEVCFDPYRLSLTAGVMARTGDPAGAMRLLERAIALAPEKVEARFQLAGVHAARGDAPNAMAQLERCTTLAPDFPDAWAHWSALLAQTGDRAGAERTLAAGLKNCPQSPGLHLMRARQLRQTGRAAEAIGAYRTAIRHRANEAEAYVELATLLIGLDRTAEALALVQQALDVEPGEPVALGIMAFSAISAGDEAGARRWLQQVFNQPRVPREQLEQLLAAYRGQFGHPFR
ncbi:MAG: tetratricopeptide repeat protein [Verrucomicrobia bacterium]|nr:tetratricopeptide repeat protein [Verrucomicrobiota bacterium]